MVREKDNRCDKFALRRSFNNLRDGSQDFTKIMVSSPRIETSFNNGRSGSQNFKGLKIQCDDKSIWDSFEKVARFGMDKLFNYDGNRSQTFSDFTFLEYLKTLATKMRERKIETQNLVAILTQRLSSMAYGSNDKRGATSSNNSTQHDNHTGNNRHRTISTPSVTTTTISLPNSSRRTPNHDLFSGIVQCFNNSEEGSQDFSHAKIRSTAIGDSFNNLGSGDQYFRKAEIRCAEKSSKPSRPTLPLPDHVVHSFNKKGSQCFDGFKLN